MMYFPWHESESERIFEAIILPVLLNVLPRPVNQRYSIQPFLSIELPNFPSIEKAA
jgi:hypothetical protein